MVCNVKYMMVVLRATLLLHDAALQEMAVCSICLTDRLGEKQDR